jgi:DNA-binding NarL/FixJ family response regulator
VTSIANSALFVPPDPCSSVSSLLPDREREVLALLATGQTTRDIADTLCLSIKTVESYYAHIKRRFTLAGMHALVAFACAWEGRQAECSAPPLSSHRELLCR